MGVTLVFSKPPPQLPKSTTPLPVFKFSEEYFQPEATEDASDQQKNLNNCEKVYKNSMICLVCKDPETTAKSEQCSYVSHPDEKLNYNEKKKPDVPKEKESLQAQPRIARDQSEESGEETSSYSSYPDSSGYYSYSSDDGDDGGDGGDANDEVSGSYDTFSNNYDSPSGNYDGSSSNYDTFVGNYNSPAASSAEYTSESERISQKAAKDHCDEVERDDMICMICKDPKTGDNYEKCSYAFKPREKSYKYSKSNTFGYPEENVNKSHQKRKTKKVPSIRERSDNEDQAELEELATAGSSNDGCREEVRDSMVCTVCKDPKTGANSENCSYSYRPDEKVYAYTASKTFGSPGEKKSSDESE